MNPHDTIINALADELRERITHCRVVVNESPIAHGWPPDLRIDGLTEGSGNICTVRATSNGILVIGSYETDLKCPMVEYCNPDLADILVQMVKSEIATFQAVKDAIRARFASSITHYHPETND